MNKIIIIPFYFVFVLHGMNESINEIIINRAQTHDISAMTKLSHEVIEDFFEPTMRKAYAEYGKSAIDEFFSGANSFF